MCPAQGTALKIYHTSAEVNTRDFMIHHNKHHFRLQNVPQQTPLIFLLFPLSVRPSWVLPF